MANIGELVYEGRMTKTTSKERGKGPEKGKGRPPGKKGETSKDRDNVPGEDGVSGSDSERLRQRILETEGMTLSYVEASGSGRREAETEDINADEEDEIETEAVRKKAEAAKKKVEVAARKVKTFLTSFHTTANCSVVFLT